MIGALGEEQCSAAGGGGTPDGKRGGARPEAQVWGAPPPRAGGRPPRPAPPGAHSLLAFISRVGGWLDTRPVGDGSRILAVAEPAVVRAALVYALKAPPSTYWNIDVRPLSTVTLTGHGGRWNLRIAGEGESAAAV
ncbi:histidine phosphatase family protein, partial [Streptomyces sp. NPDC059037]|uniref:histidine phosphatase family protein n=1 Tax=Streptomyces sp. NPDC059037 TaxID=3346710 RepID=UPI0036ABAD1C